MLLSSSEITISLTQTNLDHMSCHNCSLIFLPNLFHSVSLALITVPHYGLQGFRPKRGILSYSELLLTYSERYQA